MSSTSRSRYVQSVVLVDDDEDVLLSLERDLRDWSKRHGLKVYAVHSAEECLRLVHEEYPAIGLVVSDLRMPGMNGADLFVRLNDEFSDIGCILVTAYADMDQITRAVSSSLLGLVQKPWSIPAFEADLDRALEHVEYRRGAEERSREINQQLELAGAFQQAAVAVSVPPDQRVSYGVFSRSARELHVTGDFSDLLRLDGDRYMMLLGDVAGHGVRAALLSAMLKIVVRSHIEGEGHPVSGPAELLQLFNRTMSTYLPETSDMIASCVVAVVDVASGLVHVANAGHPPAYVVAEGTYRFSTVLDPALGMDPPGVYREETMEIGRNNRVVLLSDGLYAVPGAVGESFSRTRTGTIFQGAHRGADFFENVIRLVMADRILQGQPTVPLFDDDVTIASLLVR
jgi:phosphoserine phosphatase RsbU/P